MSEAPERIWAWEYKGNSPWGPVKPNLDVVKNGAEYIRADHVDALLKAEREKALREAALEPVTVRRCQKCGAPEDNHPYRHPFVSIENPVSRES